MSLNRGKVKASHLAKWIFERDQARGLCPSDVLWDDVDEENKKEYLDEGQYYLHSVHPTVWPETFHNRAMRI